MANKQIHLNSQERIRMDDSGMSDSLADFKYHVERGSWAQHIDTQDLSQVDITTRGRDSRGKNEECRLTKV